MHVMLNFFALSQPIKYFLYLYSMLTARKVYYGYYVAELSMLAKSASFLFARIKVDWAPIGVVHVQADPRPKSSHGRAWYA
jgi:hypothetical protein